MALDGPVLLVDSDENDTEVITAAIKDLGLPNKVNTYRSCKEVVDYLLVTEDKPFVILCDVQLPEMDGLAFRKSIVNNSYLKRKSIPFVFLTRLASQELINHAYDLDVQGFFEKKQGYAELKEQLLSILIYWKKGLHPNNTGKK